MERKKKPLNEMVIFRAMLDGAGYPYLVREDGRFVSEAYVKYSNDEAIVSLAQGQLRLNERAEEYVYGFALNNAGQLMGVFEIGHGSSTKSFVPHRETFQKLLLLRATGFVLVHNHPSGDPSPSEEDDAVTKRFLEAGKLMEITLLDHVIVAGNYYFSYIREGRMADLSEK